MDASSADETLNLESRQWTVCGYDGYWFLELGRLPRVRFHPSTFVAPAHVPVQLVFLGSGDCLFSKQLLLW
jgi:hypothetical protein